MNVAFIGTGILGFPMAEKLLDHGHRLWVFNRTRKKARPLEKMGAVICSSVKDAIQPAELIILVLTDLAAIENVLFKNGKGSFKGKTIIQMGTIGSDESKRLQKRIKHLHGDYLECPVLGSKNEARNGALILMVGGSAGQFKKWAAILKAFGPRPRLIGPVGQAATLKLALNHLIAAHAVCFSLSLGLIRKAKINVELFMMILKESSLTSPMYDKKLPNWLKSKYDNPNFPLRHLIKDVDLILTEARQQKMNTVVLSSIRRALQNAEKQGWAKKDYSAVYESIV